MRTQRNISSKLNTCDTEKRCRNIGSNSSTTENTKPMQAPQNPVLIRHRCRHNRKTCSKHVENGAQTVKHRVQIQSSKPNHCVIVLLSIFVILHNLKWVWGQPRLTQLPVHSGLKWVTVPQSALINNTANFYRYWAVKRALPFYRFYRVSF